MTFAAGSCLPLPAQVGSLEPKIGQLATQWEARVIEWRRHFHQNPELSNREFKTAETIAQHLRDLGLEVQTGIAHTGVVGILRGNRPTPVIALRADIDGLPVTERVDLPFASRARSTYRGQDVGVMHACGHDTHIAILMGVASILAELREEIPGTVKFIFQPAEEGAPQGEEGGAGLMVRQGVLQAPDVDAIFALHIWSKLEVGKIHYRPGALLAAADVLRIKVKGKQTHGSTPWTGVDPVTAASQIIQGLQTIISRQTDLTKGPAVISIGSIQGGVRNNIIPEEVNMEGTIRTLDAEIQDEIHRKILLVTTKIAETMGAEAEVSIDKTHPVTFNDPALTQEMLSTLQRVAGKEAVIEVPPITGAEDFSFYAQEVPGFFFFLGGKPSATPISEAAPHHTPDFYVDEGALKLGLEAMANLAIDYLATR
jgi:amidohydrolase